MHAQMHKRPQPLTADKSPRTNLSMARGVPINVLLHIGNARRRRRRRRSTLAKYWDDLSVRFENTGAMVVPLPNHRVRMAWPTDQSLNTQSFRHIAAGSTLTDTGSKRQRTEKHTMDTRTETEKHIVDTRALVQTARVDIIPC